jgi:hypothetical protein
MRQTLIFFSFFSFFYLFLYHCFPFFCVSNKKTKNVSNNPTMQTNEKKSKSHNQNIFNIKPFMKKCPHFLISFARRLFFSTASNRFSFFFLLLKKTQFFFNRRILLHRYLVSFYRHAMAAKARQLVAKTSEDGPPGFLQWSTVARVGCNCDDDNAHDAQRYGVKNFLELTRNTAACRFLVTSARVSVEFPQSCANSTIEWVGCHLCTQFDEWLPMRCVRPRGGVYFEYPIEHALLSFGWNYEVMRALRSLRDLGDFVLLSHYRPPCTTTPSSKNGSNDEKAMFNLAAMQRGPSIGPGCELCAPVLALCIRSFRFRLQDDNNNFDIEKDNNNIDMRMLVRLLVEELRFAVSWRNFNAMLGGRRRSLSIASSFAVPTPSSAMTTPMALPPTPETTTHPRYSIMHEALMTGDDQLISYLLECGAQADEPDMLGLPPLWKLANVPSWPSSSSFVCVLDSLADTALTTNTTRKPVNRAITSQFVGRRGHETMTPLDSFVLDVLRAPDSEIDRKRREAWREIFAWFCSGQSRHRRVGGARGADISSLHFIRDPSLLVRFYQKIAPAKDFSTTEKASRRRIVELVVALMDTLIDQGASRQRTLKRKRTMAAETHRTKRHRTLTELCTWCGEPLLHCDACVRCACDSSVVYCGEPCRREAWTWAHSDRCPAPQISTSST